jgi:aryl-alcohol dehydrogenase-like predicted oxidoreductase
MTVKRIGFGAMRVTGDGIWGPPKDHENALAVLRRAVELGITLMDTADSYGPYVDEELICEALYPYPGDLVIATKGGMTRPGPNQWQTNGRPEHLRQACEGSLSRLKVDRIDLYQFHWPDPKVPFEDSVGEIARMRAEGKIRHVGLSNVSVDQLRRAQKIVPIVSVQNRYNLSDRATEDVLQACERENIGFLPWAPLMGSNSKLEGIARSHNATVAQVTLAWLLWRSPAMLPIPGTSSISHLEENIAAASLNISDDEFKSL